MSNENQYSEQMISEGSDEDEETAELKSPLILLEDIDEDEQS